MADEVVYRLVAGDGVQLTENPTTKTVQVSVPDLAQKVNTSDLSIGSTAAPGLLELATQDETNTGTDPSRAVSPATLAGRVASESMTGLIMLAGSAEALAMNNDSKALSPLRLAAALAQFGIGVTAVPGGAETVNLNSKSISGDYYINGATSSNMPWPSVSGVLSVFSTGNPNYRIQEYTSMGEPAPRMARRAQINGTWYPWVTVHTTGNFDPASKANTSGNYPGLAVGSASSAGFASSAGNADTVDGYHASAFAFASGSYPGISAGYAASAGNADTVDGYHAASLWRTDQTTFTPSYCRFPNGLIIQWGYVSVHYAGTGVTFPTTFPNACIGVFPTLQAGGAGFVPRAGNISNSGCVLSGALNASQENVRYEAVGY